MASRDAEQVVTALYSAHYDTMVTLAAELVGNVATAKEIVQDSFLALRKTWRRLPDNDKALSLLRREVVDRSWPVLEQHRPDRTTAGPGALASLDHAAVIAGLRFLPQPQQEALVLRYFGDLSDDQIASAMGISIQQVKTYTELGIAALGAALESVTGIRSEEVKTTERAIAALGTVWKLDE